MAAPTEQEPAGARSPSGPLPVLFFVPRLGTGGAEMHLLRLLNHFDRSAIRPELAVARPGGNYEHLLLPDVPVHRLTSGRIRSATLAMVRAAGPLRRLIRQMQPCVVMAVLDPAIAALNWALRGVRAGRPRMVVCVQNNFTAEQRDQKALARLFQPLINAGYRNADRVIALSQGVADDLAGQIPATREKTRVIFNAAFDEGLVARSREPCPLPRPRDVPLLVSCGRFARQKGYPFLLDAIDRVRRVRPVRLWMLGTGPELEATKAHCDRLGLNETVAFAGFQANPFPFFRAADLFVLSSLYEGFGNVIVEAMGCGAAVLSTDCPYGPAEIITPGENGWLVPPADAAALADGILHALADPERRRRVAQAGERHARNFSSTAITASYASELVSLAAPTGVAPRV